jgi:hypothetical protein
MDSFVSGKEYVNRYHDNYRFIKESNTLYTFSMDGDSMNYCRFGGKEGVSGIDRNDLGMVDPSGGPYMSINEMAIDGRKVIRIFSSDIGIGFEVE